MSQNFCGSDFASAMNTLGCLRQGSPSRPLLLGCNMGIIIIVFKVVVRTTLLLGHMTCFAHAGSTMQMLFLKYFEQHLSLHRIFSPRFPRTWHLSNPYNGLVRSISVLIPRFWTGGRWGPEKLPDLLKTMNWVCGWAEIWTGFPAFEWVCRWGGAEYQNFW